MNDHKKNGLMYLPDTNRPCLLTNNIPCRKSVRKRECFFMMRIIMENAFPRRGRRVADDGPGA
jgi:hypothetical protein